MRQDSMSKIVSLVTGGRVEPGNVRRRTATNRSQEQSGARAPKAARLDGRRIDERAAARMSAHAHRRVARLGVDRRDSAGSFLACPLAQSRPIRRAAPLVHAEAAPRRASPARLAAEAISAFEGHACRSSGSRRPSGPFSISTTGAPEARCAGGDRGRLRRRRSRRCPGSGSPWVRLRFPARRSLSPAAPLSYQPRRQRDQR